jgi:hypothetical protein
MRENEKTVREALNWVPVQMANGWKQAVSAFDSLLAEHRAEVEALRREEVFTPDALQRAVKAAERRARDAALEEARTALLGSGMRTGDREQAATIVATLKSRPAERMIPESEVRGELAHNRRFARFQNQPLVRATVADIAEALDVDLDAEAAAK